MPCISLGFQPPFAILFSYGETLSPFLEFFNHVFRSKQMTNRLGRMITYGTDAHYKVVSDEMTTVTEAYSFPLRQRLDLDGNGFRLVRMICQDVYATRVP